MLRRTFIVAAGATTALAGIGKLKADESPFYKSDDNIELIVPFGAGGGGSVFGLLIAKFLPPHIAGQPKMTVLNIEGGQSVRGANEFYEQREPDGYHLLMGAGTTHFPAIYGLPGVKYDLKNMRPVLGAGGGAMFYAGPTAGIKTAADLKNPKENLVYGGLAPIGIELARMLVLDLLDVNIKIVVGYESRGASRIAFDQGETNINGDTSSAYLTEVVDMIKEGKAIPLFAMGQISPDGELTRDPLMPDLPHPGEVYEQIHGKPASGPGWEAYKSLVASSLTVQRIIWAHHDIPEPAFAALEAAAGKMAEDPAFKEASKLDLGGYPITLGEALQKGVVKMSSPSQETLTFINGYVQTKFGVSLENAGK